MKELLDSLDAIFEAVNPLDPEGCREKVDAANVKFSNAQAPLVRDGIADTSSLNRLEEIRSRLLHCVMDGYPLLTRVDYHIQAQYMRDELNN